MESNRRCKEFCTDEVLPCYTFRPVPGLFLSVLSQNPTIKNQARGTMQVSQDHTNDLVVPRPRVIVVYEAGHIQTYTVTFTRKFIALSLAYKRKQLFC